MAKRGPKSSSRAQALELFFTHPDMSDAAIAASIIKADGKPISRQLISRWRKPFRKPNATDNGEMVAGEDSENSSGPGEPVAAEPHIAATPAILALRELAGDEQLGVLVDKILRGSAPRAAAIAVGMSGKVFASRMERDPHFRDLVLRAAHEAESSVAQNLYRLATGASPQAAQSAIAWLNARVPDDWAQGRQKIDIEVTGHVDIDHILRDPRSIQLVNELEARRQRLEDGILDADYRELPAHEDEAS